MYVKPKDLNHKAGKLSNDYGQIPFLREDYVKGNKSKGNRRRKGKSQVFVKYQQHQ